MTTISENEIWNIVPPEEKLSLLARAQASGIYTCFMLFAVAFTLAIALKLQWLIWMSLIASPLLFQTAAHRAWRRLKPRVMLEYLAARSVARRFAYAGNAQGLDLELIFRGRVAPVKDDESERLNDVVDSIEHNTQNATAWIGLLTDSVVAFTERKGGGVLEFVSIADKRLSVEGRNRDGSSGEYSQDREIYLTINKPYGKTSKFKVSSDYPAALVVFEKKLQARLEHARKQAAAREAEESLQQ